ncbi:flagellin [Brevibacillus agri]|uniref:flagellin N-terminal helical domain-containing protein n=1 Tax=Brevibacillus agri TaxID=51101 RepID=UPI002E24085A|nr:flagellin [Brevibacillus agri]MED1642048.1 flagellin [Brevibacillus agri]MED1655880.1 flagellin [Brevibacillus agri]MED1685011.1 flagellin [Brevibacillus agri]MED1693616.1 flagellin [Brevibacillus agri]MED1697570.1 flagellin [Brevibacillus agri]
MRINHNIASLNTYRQLTGNTGAASKSLEKLSSGLRINRAGDDAAGLAISEKMRGQIRGLEMASKNAQDGISLIQTAEGALNETHSILQRMRELAVQASNDTNTDTDRSELQKEIDQLVEEIDRISNTTEFNTKKLLDGSAAKAETIDATAQILSQNADKFSVVTSAITNSAITGSGSFYVKIGAATTTTAGTTYAVSITDAKGQAYTAVTAVSAGGTFAINGASISVSSALETGDALSINIKDDVTVTANSSMSFQIGANAAQTMDVDVKDMSSTALNVNGIKVSTQEAAQASITAVEMALRDVSAERAKLGAFQNRLEHTINNLGTSAENLTASESRIRDVDMAKEMMDFTKNNILTQAAQAMLAQANQQPQGVLQLLR